jgi:RNA polymerase-interacting CarD/CdnL/TRCF family regulator
MDIMAEITDEFGKSYTIINTKKTILSALEKRVVVLSIKLEIPDNRYNHFKSCFEQAKHRFYNLVGSTFGVQLDRSPVMLPSGPSKSYYLRVTFDDSKIDKDRQVVRDTPIPGQMNESNESKDSIKLIDKDEIADITTEMTDLYSCDEPKFTNQYKMKQYNNQWMQTPIAIVNYTLGITNRDRDHFYNLMDQIVHRIETMIGVEVSYDADKREWATKEVNTKFGIDTAYAYDLSIILFKSKFKDIKVSNVIDIYPNNSPRRG